MYNQKKIIKYILSIIVFAIAIKATAQNINTKTLNESGEKKNFN